MIALNNQTAVVTGEQRDRESDRHEVWRRKALLFVCRGDRNHNQTLAQTGRLSPNKRAIQPVLVRPPRHG